MKNVEGVASIGPCSPSATAMNGLWLDHVHFRPLYFTFIFFKPFILLLTAKTSSYFSSVSIFKWLDCNARDGG